MSLTVRIFLSLVAGLALGTLLAAFAGADALRITESIAEPVGGLWLDALQMCVIPLVIGLIFTGIADAAGSARTSRLGGKALMVFGAWVLGGAVLTVLWIPQLLKWWPIDPAAVSALVSQEARVEGAGTISAGQWVRGFVASNVFKALGEGAMLQIVVFTCLFATAATRLPEAPRQTLVAFFNAITQTMMVLVGWVLALAPIGVLALATLVGVRTGVGAIGVLAHYVSVVIIAQVVVIALVYVMAALMVRGGLPAFVRAVLPAQAVAVSTQSSIATLPAMLESTRALHVPEPVSRLVLPLAVSVFRVTSTPANLSVVLYVAALHGVTLGPAQLAAGVAVAFAAGIAAVGLPGQVSFITSVAPICAAMGVPIEALPLLIAVEILPDIFRTLGNVTADVAVTAVLGQEAPERLDLGG